MCSDNHIQIKHIAKFFNSVSTKYPCNTSRIIVVVVIHFMARVRPRQIGQYAEVRNLARAFDTLQLISEDFRPVINSIILYRTYKLFEIAAEYYENCKIFFPKCKK